MKHHHHKPQNKRLGAVAIAALVFLAMLYLPIGRRGVLRSSRIGVVPAAPVAIPDRASAEKPKSEPEPMAEPAPAPESKPRTVPAPAQVLRLSVMEADSSSDTAGFKFSDPNAFLADPLNLEPFKSRLEKHAKNSEFVILLEHCHQSGSGSLLVHEKALPLLAEFLGKELVLPVHNNDDIRSKDIFNYYNSDARSWADFLQKLGNNVVRPLRADTNTLFTCESNWLGNLNYANFDKFTVDDRTSPDTIKFVCDYFYGILPITEGTKERIRRGQLKRLDADNVETQVTRDGSVIFVDVYKINEFVKVVGPRIRAKFVLVSGDGDECIPDCFVAREDTIRFVGSPFLRHWYTMNCQGTEVAPDKITCMPIGVKQWDDQRASLQAAYEKGIGPKNGLEYNAPIPSDRNPDYVLVSFTISSNKEIRQPVYDLFCKEDSMHPVAKVSNCIFNEPIKQSEFHLDYVSQSRFVISPHGNGLDCYRTYEALLLGAIPVVTTSTLDPIYAHLPVLVLKKWEDLTISLMESTEKEFAKVKWDFRPLYADYWYHKVRST
ncbi:hypothetical protein HDU82_008122, partial [Entophlyctis luteolus]